jgi:hypothetical protein
MMETSNHRRSSIVADNLETHGAHTPVDLDRAGLVRLRDVVPSEWLTAARADVDAFLATHGSGEHSLQGPDPTRWECPTIAELAVDERVEAFLHSLAFPQEVPPAYAGYRLRLLRILDGSAVDSPPFDWHYDANALTMLVPIVIPDDGSGHVALFPDYRPHRRWATLSAAERLLVHNKLYGRRLRRRYEGDPAAHTVQLTPGDVYLFRGYRALHATLPWPSNTLRVTLVLQYGHPYGAEGSLVKAMRARRNSIRAHRTGAAPIATGR